MLNYHLQILCHPCTSTHTEARAGLLVGTVGLGKAGVGMGNSQLLASFSDLPPEVKFLTWLKDGQFLQQS